MKSVKNFFVERLSSIDHSGNDPSLANNKDKDKQQKQTDETSTGTSVSGGDGDESPVKYTDDYGNSSTPQTQTPNTAPASVPAEKSFISAFDFTTTTTSNTNSTPTTVTTPTANNKPIKNRRKISLPWGRQSSVAKNLGLSRQHTIDTPNSFRLFSRQSSKQIKVCKINTRFVSTVFFLF